MKTLLLAASIFGAVSMSPPFASIDTGCTYATISDHDEVTIDWRCVSRSAETYRLRKGAATNADAFAFVLESLRDGTASIK